VLAAVSLLLILGCFVSACSCRARWADLSPSTRFILALFAAGVAGLYAFMLCTGWSSTSALINESIGALAVGGYSLLILLLTLFHPKILTWLVTTVLLLPVPVAFVLLPLSAPSGGTIAPEHVVGNLYVDKVHWDAGAMGSSGTTLLLYEKPRLVPFVKHHLQRIVFDDAKCLSDKAFVILQPDRRHVLARCPWPEYLHKEGFHDFLVPLY
jgi:hypothetical protein